MNNKIIPNQHVTLRVLTMKSKLGFGQYADYTIERIFINQKQDYLQWVYYYCSNISFCDEILEKLKIKDWVIKKPGICTEFFDKYKYDLKLLCGVKNNCNEIYVNKITEGIQKNRVIKELAYVYVPKGRKDKTKKTIS